MMDHTDLQDRMISRARNLATPVARLQELAPRLLQCLPDTVGGCAERLNATRREIEDCQELLADHVVYRGGRLVSRDLGPTDWIAGGYRTR